jgi:hypothetical protein
MAKYSVLIPIAGSIEVEVEADDEESAVQAALATEFTEEDLQSLTWESMEHICQGNVCYAPTWSAEANLID